jgi:hypothetical protein
MDGGRTRGKIKKEYGSCKDTASPEYNSMGEKTDWDFTTMDHAILTEKVPNGAFTIERAWVQH